MPAPLLYEINTRCWLRELSAIHRQPITLANVPAEELAGWRRLGFTHIWLMGVWSSGARSRQQALSAPSLRQAYATALPDWTEADVGGSPYALADYHVPAALGADDGLREFRRQLLQHGLKLVLDFVPNHLGLDHPWLKEHPERFVQSEQQVPGTFSQPTGGGVRWLAHGKDPYFGAWTDTVQLDYRLPATREAMSRLLCSVADRCDGVRCDMAMLLLNDVFARTWAKFPVAGAEQAASPTGSTGASAGEPVTGQTRPEPAGEGAALQASDGAPPTEFWSSTIASVKNTHPDFLFLAEVYWGLEPRLHELGFNYTYDKPLYDLLVARATAPVQQHLLKSGPELLAAGAHFLENHDEPRIASLLEPAEHRAAALVILGLPGMRLLHEGQLAGARLRAPVQLVRRALEPAQPEVRRLYEQMLAALPGTAVGRGTPQVLKPRPAWPGNPTAENFVIVQWQTEPDAFDLVVVNLAAHLSQCYAPLTVPGLASHNWSMNDLLGDERYIRSGEDLESQGLYLDVPAHGAQLFHFEPGR